MSSHIADTDHFTPEFVHLSQQHAYNCELNSVFLKKLLLLVLLMPALCNGQKNYCKKISKTVDATGTIYNSPDLRSISVIKQLKMNSFFGLNLHFEDTHKHFDAVGAAIEFEDGTILKDRTAKVHCNQEMVEINLGNQPGVSAAHSGGYLVQGFFHINDENIEKFVSKKIVRIELDNTSKMISDKDAVKVMNYIKCIQNSN